VLSASFHYVCGFPSVWLRVPAPQRGEHRGPLPGPRPSTNRKRAAIRAVLHRVIIRPLAADVACNPASSIIGIARCCEREMVLLWQRVEFDWRV
jgi:hypothetical protein